jgi:hypothetical protein
VEAKRYTSNIGRLMANLAAIWSALHEENQKISPPAASFTVWNLNKFNSRSKPVSPWRKESERERQQRATTSLITSDQIRSQPCCRFYTKSAATDCHCLRRIRHRVTLPNDVNNQQTHI